MIYAALVAASFLLVRIAEHLFYDSPSEYYYLSLLTTSAAVIYLCSLKINPLAAGYAALQFLVSLGYMLLIAGTENATLYRAGELVLWDYTYNLSLILFSYELAIIAYGGMDALFAAVGRRLDSFFSLHTL